MAVRCVHEASLHDANSFVTLTYDESKLSTYSLVYKDYQDFAKRLRARGVKFRYFMCGEYGERNFRPHFHALLFGWRPPDLVRFKELGTGDVVYTSEFLDEVWGNGHTNVGQVSLNSAQYVARYAQKSVTGADEHWKRRDVTKYGVCVETGETWLQVPEFVRMSNGGGRGSDKLGGIGAQWFKLYNRDVYGSQVEPSLDRVVVNGRQIKPPKYYDTLLSRLEAGEYRLEYVKFRRELEALRRGDSELSPARLLQREAVARARLLLKTRGL